MTDPRARGSRARPGRAASGFASSRDARDLRSYDWAYDTLSAADITAVQQVTATRAADAWNDEGSLARSSDR
jgi:hypothetical protein